NIVNLRHAGLSLATAIAATVNLGVLLSLLRRQLPAMRWRDTLPSALRSLVASLAMIPVLELAVRQVDWAGGSLLWRVAALLASVASGGAVYAIVAAALGSAELTTLREMLSRRMSRAA
ncbi:MAG TPA: hypothetical protein VEB21_07545, partial [Terriglobales bacterium]|nr:hypothetical protein [Terriglobales bacterium]